MPSPSHAPKSFDDLVAGSGLPRLEARALLESASGRRREWLIAHGPQAPSPEVAERFEALAGRRRAGVPIAYLLGHREFMGLRFEVDPSVLIPRPETEALVELAIGLAPAGARVLDLGTGSGAIAIALAHARPDLRLTATDRSAAALTLARRNAASLLPQDGPIDWREGSWWDTLTSTERFELILSNPPYIAGDDPHLGQGDLRHEPRGALAGGADGLDDLRIIVAGAPGHLLDGGVVALEHGWDQGPAVRELMRQAGLAAIRTVPDAQQHDRITFGTLA